MGQGGAGAGVGVDSLVDLRGAAGCNAYNIYLGTTRPNDDEEPEDHAIDIELRAFMVTFCLNYCSTSHKAQNETITEDFTIHDWDKMRTKCRYTALSRAKKPEQVLFGKIDLPFEIKTFESNTKNKKSGHLKYDMEKNLK